MSFPGYIGTYLLVYVFSFQKILRHLVWNLGVCAYRWSNYCVPILVPIRTYLQSEQRYPAFGQSNGFSRVHWRVNWNIYELVCGFGFHNFLWHPVWRSRFHRPKAVWLPKSVSLRFHPEKRCECRTLWGIWYSFRLYREQAARARVVWHLADFAISISAARNRSECIAVWKFIQMSTCEIIMRETARFLDRRCISAILASWCTMLKFGCQNREQGPKLDSFNFRVIRRWGGRPEIWIFGILIYFTQVSHFVRLTCQLRAQPA
jgi:hypothetical protein